jgi:shikimate dehydrogenase
VIKAAVLGSDVSRSRSPAIHQAAYRALGVEGEYRAFSVAARGFRPQIAQLMAEGYRYVNVTIPHKQAAARLATTQSAAVRVAGAANTLIFGGGKKVRAENTDGDGLLAALDDLGTGASARTVVMVGAGGAAAGALEALTAAGARVHLVARRPAAGRGLRQRLPARRRPQITVHAWRPEALASALAQADILISAVPAAAWASHEACAGLASLNRKVVVLEMAYGTDTPLGQAVRGHVRRYSDGLGMLVHQAACAIEHALGHRPPLPPLFRAARRG